MRDGVTLSVMSASVAVFVGPVLCGFFALTFFSLRDYHAGKHPEVVRKNADSNMLLTMLKAFLQHWRSRKAARKNADTRFGL